MKINHFNIILLSLVLLTFGFQCDEEVEPVYDFELPYQVSPAKKEYHINDTIRISTFIKDRSLKDLSSQKQVELMCTDLPVRFYAGVRWSNDNLLNSMAVFETIVDSVNFSFTEIENNSQYSKCRVWVADSIFY